VEAGRNVLKARSKPTSLIPELRRSEVRWPCGFSRDDCDWRLAAQCSSIPALQSNRRLRG